MKKQISKLKLLILNLNDDEVHGLSVVVAAFASLALCFALGSLVAMYEDMQIQKAIPDCKTHVIERQDVHGFVYYRCIDAK